MLKPLEEY